jgi:hypothetical protein
MSYEYEVEVDGSAIVNASGRTRQFLTPGMKSAGDKHRSPSEPATLHRDLPTTRARLDALESQ